MANGNVEENSGLGKAVSYFNKHYGGLTAFCRLKVVQLDNNWAEEALKLVGRNRKMPCSTRHKRDQTLQI
nr:IS66 family transposase [Vibrio panuliri]